MSYWSYYDDFQNNKFQCSSLSLSARNILNKQDYRLTTYSGVTSSTAWYRLRPREVLLEAQVSLLGWFGR